MKDANKHDPVLRDIRKFQGDDNSDEEEGTAKIRKSKIRKQTSIIGDYNYLGGDKVRSKDFPIVFLSIFMIGAPSALFLIWM